MPAATSRRVLALALAHALAAGACAGPQGLRSRPGSAEARGFFYGDNAGLSVITAGATVAQPVSRAVTVSAQGVVDHLKIVPPAPEMHSHSGGNQSTGHDVHGDDAITGASARITGGAVTEKTRVEGVVGASADSAVGDRPLSFGGQVRVSHEPDYQSYAALLRGKVELFQRNLTATMTLGFGHDVVSPTDAPPGQASLWPASHRRFNAGATLSQILSPSVILSGGLAFTHQFGVLASPYRRALVRTSLFPEIVPGTRSRGTAFAELSWYLGAGAVLRLRQGLYADTWAVLGFIPEASIVKELGERGLLTLRYRFYRQSAASFYEARYDDVLPVMSSDPRLGRVREHAPGVAIRVTALGRRGDFGSLTLDASYDLSALNYEDTQIATILGHVVSVGAQVSY